MDRLSSRALPAELSWHRPSIASAASRGLLDRVRARVLFVLDHAGVLFDALLLGTGNAACLGNDFEPQANAPSRHSRGGGDRIGRVPVILLILFKTAGLPAPGDISVALNQHPELYTLSLGHMLDLTWSAFAYLRLPLAIAAVATLIGALGGWFTRGSKAVLLFAAMMVVFVQAAHVALIAFDPYLSSHALAKALLKAPAGELIIDDQYYAFSSMFFYTDRKALLLNGRTTNLEYGSYAPEAPNPFINDRQFAALWKQPRRFYLTADGQQLARFQKLVGTALLQVVQESGGKYLFTNLPL